MKNTGKTILWTVLLLIIGLLSVNMYMNINEMKTGIDVSEDTATIQKPFLQREEINTKIKEELQKGRVEEMVAIYTGITGDSSLARTIMNYSLIYNIPTSLLFAIISTESEFDPRAINRNSNRTYDYGLMSLNSRTFKGYTKEQLLEIDTNLRLGCEFLLKLKKRYKTWGEAVIHYNGLYTKGAGSYMVKVMERERNYERLFNEKTWSIDSQLPNDRESRRSSDKNQWIRLFRA